MWLGIRAGMRSLDIQREFGIEPLLLRLKWSQVRWFGLRDSLNYPALVKQTRKGIDEWKSVSNSET